MDVTKAADHESGLSYRSGYRLRILLLASFRKRLTISAITVAALMLLVLALAVLNQYDRWRFLKDDFEQWTPTEQARCEKLLTDIKQQIKPILHCDLIRPSWSDEAINCIAREQSRRAEITQAFIMKNKCPTREPFDPGSLLEYTAIHENIEIDTEAVAVGFIGGVISLLLLMDVANRLLVESNPGWRRLNIMLPILGGLLGGGIYAIVGYDPFPTALGVAASAPIGTLVALVYGRLIALWVKAGFAANPQDATSTPKEQISEGENRCK